MSGQYPMNDPRAYGGFSGGDPQQPNGWRPPDPTPRAPRGYRQDPPRYIPGGSPPPFAARSTRGRLPSQQSQPGQAHQSMPSGARTDPTLYQWDRLTPEQQQAVLITLGGRGTRARTSPRVFRLLLLIALLVLLIAVAVFALHFMV